MHTHHSINKNKKWLDDLGNEEEIIKDEYPIDNEEDEIYCTAKGMF